MRRVIRHVALPSALSLAFFAIAATPVEVMGCLNRGVAALAVALLSGAASLGAALVGLRGRVRGDESSGWWVASSLVLAIPVASLLLMA